MKTIKHSNNRRIKRNIWDNWVGYEGTRRVKDFADTPEYTAEQNAQRWFNEGQSAISPAV